MGHFRDMKGHFCRNRGNFAKILDTQRAFQIHRGSDKSEAWDFIVSFLYQAKARQFLVQNLQKTLDLCLFFYNRKNFTVYYHQPKAIAIGTYAMVRNRNGKITLTYAQFR